MYKINYLSVVFIKGYKFTRNTHTFLTFYTLLHIKFDSKVLQKYFILNRKIQHQERPFGPQLLEKGRNIYRLPDRHSYAWLQPNRDSSEGHTNGYDLVNNGYKTIQERRNTGMLIIKHISPASSQKKKGPP